jgi:hypothetical protein
MSKENMSVIKRVLAAAGLLEGSYTAVVAVAHACDRVFAQWLPGTQVSRAGLGKEPPTCGPKAASSQARE